MSSAKVRMANEVIIHDNDGLHDAVFDVIEFDQGHYANLPDGLKAPVKGIYLVGVSGTMQCDVDTDQAFNGFIHLSSGRNCCRFSAECNTGVGDGYDFAACDLVELDQDEQLFLRIDTVGLPGFDFTLQMDDPTNGMWIALAWMLP